MDTVTFTDKVLANNFSDIANALSSAEKVLRNHSGRLGMLEDRVDDLSQVVFSTTKHLVEISTKAPKRPGKLVTLTVVGGAAYFGYRFAQEEFKRNRSSYRNSEELRNKQAANAKPSNGDDTGEAKNPS